MMYQNAVDQVRDQISTNGKCFKMAKVAELNGENAKIKFFGETFVSSKSYKRLHGYIPSVGDVVLLCKVANTYVILGKVV